MTPYLLVSNVITVVSNVAIELKKFVFPVGGLKCVLLPNTNLELFKSPIAISPNAPIVVGTPVPTVGARNGASVL